LPRGAAMKRSLGLATVLVLLALPLTAHARADFDPALNGLRLKGDALKTFDFESADSLVGVELGSWVRGQGYLPKLERTKIEKPEDVGDRLTNAVDAIEGSHGLRLGADGKGLVIADQALFAQVKDGKFEVTLWARADGAGPQLHVVYDKSAANVYAGGTQFATVRGVRTGRETDDGWAEFSTGPLDGSIWGAPVQAVLVLASSAAEPDTSFVIDALEIRKLEGKPVEALACTQANVDSVCGAEGDCMFGHCISSTATWGVLPPAAHREEIAERWIQFGTRMIGDRNAAQNGAKILAPGAREIAKNATSSRHFFGGMARFVNLLRDNHTSFGSPGNLTSFNPQVQQGTSSALGACFGLVEKDIMGGGLGFAVYRAGQTPLSGVPLKRGDVIVAIDGQDPKKWVDEMWPRFATTLPNDPASDWGSAANDLSRLVTTRATSVTLERCASASSCGDGAREKITIDIASVAYKAITNPTEGGTNSRPFSCTSRFSNAVEAQGQGFGGYGEDAVLTTTGTGGETRVQFDGFVGQTKWQSSMTNVFSSGNARVLMDARMGHGGYYTTVEHLFHLLRGKSEPMGVLSMGRGTYDMVDPPWLVSGLSECTAATGANQWTCFAGNANGFFATETAPAGAATKIAWLNTHDVSANDFMPRLLKGRSNFHIFAPHPTSGAFGAITQLPPLYTNYGGGSLQIQDARFAADLDKVATARWESGHGVEPDTIVVQKLSDALNGTDTLLTAATAWLAQ
jgi:hypothetical protein